MSREIIKTTVIIAISLSILITGSFFVSQFIYRSDKILLNISTSPQDSNITINGTRLESNNIYLKPGKYLISVTKNGYYEYRKIYEVSEQNSKLKLTLKSKPKTIYSMLYSSDYKELISKLPIIKKLPYNTSAITMSYDGDSTIDSFAINISANEGFRYIAIEKIKSWGFSPTDYNIKFKDYTNPFAL